MNKVIGFGQFLLKSVLMGVVFIGTCIAKCIGAIICASAGN